MIRGQEIEYKLAIPDQRSFDELIRLAGGRRGTTVQQVNHFFDTPDGALGRQGIGLRLRLEPDRSILTLKGPARTAGHDAPIRRAELEVVVDARQAADVVCGRASIAGLLTGLRRGDHGAQSLLGAAERARGAGALVSTGSFTNQRTPVRTTLPGMRGLVCLEFDRTEFPGGRIDFEVELELDDVDHAPGAGRGLRRLFDAAGVDVVPSAGKLERFRAILATGAGTP